MSARNEAELIAALEKAMGLVVTQHETIKALVVQYMGLTTAVTPVMVACSSEDALVGLRVYLVKSQDEMNALIARVEQAEGGLLH